VSGSAALGSLGLALLLGAQLAAPADLRYTPEQLRCARFRERSTGVLDATTGTVRRNERLARAGIWSIRGSPRDGAIAIEAWYDSLALSREGLQGKLAPDTDGLLGGRYRGVLTPAGRYTPSARPFVPDEVAEVADLSRAMEDLLPRLPGSALEVGGRWQDSTGIELRRMADSVAGRRTIWRLEVRGRAETEGAQLRADTLALPGHEVTVETGRIDWDPAAGLLRRVRHLVVETSVPATGPLRAPLRSRLEQRITLTRLRPPASCL
jgi:hypothetical protein